MRRKKEEMEMQEQEIKKTVRERYAGTAKGDNSCCAPSCCDGQAVETISKTVGYTDDDMQSVPEGANLGLGCGNPVALASLKEGETVLDLGSGAGFDAFLSAREVGETGRVIGVDMTPEMLDKARENAQKGNFRNVEFRLGEIENLPAADSSVDVIISNCVINLSPDKTRVFKEAHRVLKPGGRLMVSDIVLLKDLPDFARDSIDAYVGCVAGAMLKDEYLATIREAGFENVEVNGESKFGSDVAATDPIVNAIVGDSDVPPEEWKKVGESVVSLKVQAIKT